MNLSNATLGQVFIPVEDFERGPVFYRDILGVHATLKDQGVGFLAAPEYGWRTLAPAPREKPA